MATLDHDLNLKKNKIDPLLCTVCTELEGARQAGGGGPSVGPCGAEGGIKAEGGLKPGRRARGKGLVQSPRSWFQVCLGAHHLPPPQKSQRLHPQVQLPPLARMTAAGFFFSFLSFSSFYCGVWGTLWELSPPTPTLSTMGCEEATRPWAPLPPPSGRGGGPETGGGLAGLGYRI